MAQCRSLRILTSACILVGLLGFIYTRSGQLDKRTASETVNTAENRANDVQHVDNSPPLRCDDLTNITDTFLCKDYQYKCLQTESWYPRFLKHLRIVQGLQPCPQCTKPRKFEAAVKPACSRWWKPQHQHTFYEKPMRVFRNSTKPKNFVLPKCAFGQEIVPRTKCSDGQEQLFKALNSLGVAWHPRAGTELGIVWQSSYLSKDGDIDIWVDMPIDMLLEKLSKVLSPKPHTAGRGVSKEIQWKGHSGKTWCPEAHIIYNDWTMDEYEKITNRDDLCSCKLNSVDVVCHKDAPGRMYSHFGPAWVAQFGLKGFDVPYWMMNNPGDLHTKWARDGFNRILENKSRYIRRVTEEYVRSIIPEKMMKLYDPDIPLVVAQANIYAAQLGVIKH